MRILFFADNFPPEVNAPATHIFERCRIWAAAGHEVTVITCAPNFPQGRIHTGYRNALRHVETIEGIRVARVWSYIAANEGVLRRALDYASYVPMALFASLLEKRPDVIISSSPQLLVPLAGLLCGLLRWRPHVFELRDLWPASMLATGALQRGFVYRLLERLELLMYRASSRVLAFTESFRRDLVARGVSETKIDVVYGGFSDSLSSDNSTQRDVQLVDELKLRDRFVVGYIGTLGLAHGLENILATAEQLQEQPISFLLVGDGAAKRELVAAARNRELDNVIFVDIQPKQQLTRYWSLCDAALVHLRDDPVFSTVVPSKIFEAMTLGKPLLYAGPCGEASRLIHSHNVGLTVAAMDADALAGAATRLFDDSCLRERLARNSAAAAQQYTRTRQAEATLDVLREAIDGTANREAISSARR